MRILNVGLMIGNPENGFQKAMRKVATDGYLDMQCHAGTQFNSDLVRTAREFQPNIIFLQIQQENIISEETAKELASIAFTINFSGDIRDTLPQWYLDIGKHIHLSTFSNMDDVFTCRKNCVASEYLEIGVDHEIYQPRAVSEGYDIVAHFNHYENMFPLSQYRVDIVNALRSEFGDKFGVFGNFPSSDGNWNGSQEQESINYNKAKIAINCSHFSVERYSSDRLLRAMASGCMVLSHDFKGIEQDYVIGRHLDVFDSIEELITKCKFYLAHDLARKIIAKNGCNYVHKNHTFEAMCENITKLYRQNK